MDLQKAVDTSDVLEGIIQIRRRVVDVEIVEVGITADIIKAVG